MSEVAKTTGTFTSFDGTEIYYEVRGTGRPVVLCYGIACLMNHWRHQVKYFSPHYQTILFDYRGHHKSACPAAVRQQNITAIARDLNALLQHLGIHKASLWGHSFGTQMLLRAYELFPEMFENLILINGFAANPLNNMFGSTHAARAFHWFRTGYEHLPLTLSLLWRLAVTNPLAIYLTDFAGGFNLRLTSFKDVEVYARGVGSLNLEYFLALFEDMTVYDGRPVLEKIAVPTLIIGGQKDAVTPQKHQKYFLRKIRNSSLLMIPYGSHCAQLDMPDLVNLRIEKFLKDHQYA